MPSPSPARPFGAGILSRPGRVERCALVASSRLSAGAEAGFDGGESVGGFGAVGTAGLGHIGTAAAALAAECFRARFHEFDGAPGLDQVLRQEVEAKQRKRVAMGVQIAHFPSIKTLEEFEFKFQPSIDQRLVRELATGRFISAAENVLIFGPPGVGKTHLAIALGRAAVETGHSVLFTSATALLAALAKAESEGQLADRLLFYTKPKLLVIDELGYLPFERRSAHLFFQLVARRYERCSRPVKQSLNCTMPELAK